MKSGFSTEFCSNVVAGLSPIISLKKLNVITEIKLWRRKTGDGENDKKG